MDAIRDFRDLIVWQRARDFAKEIYRLTRYFPKEEQFGLTLQLRRAAVSVSSNIAEGHARQGKEFLAFLSIARGSLAEAESQLLLSVDFGYLTASDIAPAHDLAVEVGRMSASLTKKIKSRYANSHRNPRVSLSDPLPLTPGP